MASAAKRPHPSAMNEYIVSRNPSGLERSASPMTRQSRSGKDQGAKKATM